jgi:hypothetical protein
MEHLLIDINNGLNELSGYDPALMTAHDDLRILAVQAAKRLLALIQTPSDAIRSLAFSVSPPRTQSLGVC